MNYSELVTKNQRQAILELLRDQNGYSINAAILQSALSNLGMAISSTALISMLIWLAESNYISITNDGVIVASITQTGLDIANGHTQHPDIARPKP